MKKQLGLLFFLSFSLLVSLFLVKKAINLFPKANEQTANLEIDAQTTIGEAKPIWQALAQGGEEKFPFNPILKQITDLKPSYIRIDHIYDFYDVVTKTDQGLSFNWSQLDQIVNQILKTGALPFFSLSYMPPAIAKDGDITGLPNSWSNWTQVVQKTIEHYSDKNQKNLNNVIYEVWNEPDLFGHWQIGGEKDYRLLYQYAAIGASQAQNVNPFKIGGPSITQPYENWVNGFLDYLVENQIRIDFYSYHRYTTDPEKFQEDIQKVNTWLTYNGGFSLEKYLTEFGSESDNSSLHDGYFDAAHLVASIRQLLGKLDLAFTFEIKDGPSPEGKKYWGRWGLLTHEKAGPISAKPRYQVFNLLNQMTPGYQLKLTGEGDWVTGWAIREGKQVKILLTNLDLKNNHYEITPLTINNLDNGLYAYQETYLLGQGRSGQETITNQQLSKLIPLTANNVVLIQLTKI